MQGTSHVWKVMVHVGVRGGCVQLLIFCVFVHSSLKVKAKWYYKSNLFNCQNMYNISILNNLPDLPVYVELGVPDHFCVILTFRYCFELSF